MFVAPLIERKRDGQALQAHEWTSLIRSYVAGTIPDYQMSALLMAQTSYCMFGRAIRSRSDTPLPISMPRDEQGASAVQEPLVAVIHVLPNPPSASLPLISHRVTDGGVTPLAR
ncbi:MAG: hypothetical protein V3T56_08940 [Gemmatimonadales bacterium]